MAQKIQFRRDTSANWANVNPILSQGELGYETNTGKFKIGNGLQYWNELSYASMDGVAFSQLTGTIGETQIPSGANAVILPSQLKAENSPEAGLFVKVGPTGQFFFTTTTFGGGNISLVGQTGQYGDLFNAPQFALGLPRATGQVKVPGQLVEGSQYTILTLGGSDWTLSGASANTTGTIFTALNNGNAAGGSGTVELYGRFAVALTGSYKDVLDTPTLLSQFQNDVGYVSTVTLGDYVTTSEVVQLVGDEIDNLIGTSGEFFNIIEQLTALSTSTATIAITEALDNRLRIDINNQNLTTQQKANGVANLGLAPVAVTGSYNDLVDVPATFTIQPATSSTIGGVLIGSGLSVDNVGRISVNTSTVKVEFIEGYENFYPTGYLTQERGMLRAGQQDYLYFAESTFQPGSFVPNVTSTGSFVVSTQASQWLAAINSNDASYVSGKWRLYNTTRTESYAVTDISQAAGVAYFTLDTQINYNSSDPLYVATNDSWSRIPLMDDYGTQKANVGGLEPTTVAGTVNLPTGQTYGTTATLLTVDCTGITYGELALSFTDTNNTEYYKGIVEIHLYPDNTYIIQPNLAGNKTDRVAVAFSSGLNAPYTTSSSIKIPVYNTDKNIATNLTQSTCNLTNVKYSWVMRVNI